LARPPGNRRSGSKGQILPLTVLMMVTLIGITGLAIDVSSALSTQRYERAITDAASLAGAQDLQRAGTRRAPGPTEQSNARRHAMDVLVKQLGASSTPSTAVGSACLTATGCALPGTPYSASIETPSPSCIDCADHPELAVQVTLQNPSFGLSFSRLLGQSQWRVASTSVASIVHSRAYGVFMLRPPLPPNNRNLTDPNEDDFFITGGSILNITGDIGTNTNLVYSGTNSLINLDSSDCSPTCDYRGYHFDAYQAASWVGKPPTPQQIQAPILDPGYRIPVRSATVPTYSTEAQALDTTGCAAQQALVPAAYKMQNGISIKDLPASQVFCYKPGVYQFQINNSKGGTTNPTAFLLEPGTGNGGVFWLDKGLSNSSTIVGGYQPGTPGVALVFPECKNSQCQLSGQSSDLLALNFGDQYSNPSGTRAMAAQCGSDCQVAGPVQAGTTPPVLMSLMVVPDPGCYVDVQEPPTCNESNNKTLNLPGGGNLFVAGVQYAPTDNVNIKGNATTTGTLGELISWTVKFDSSFLNLESAAVEKSGVLRLDRACSPSETVCNP